MKKSIRRYHLNLLEIGKQIKILRKERAYTQEEFAKLIGISRATLSKLENGIFSKVSALVLENALSTLGYGLSIEPKNPFVKR